ncbi:MAG: CBS domain-containing protein [Bacillota bacterium]
MKVKDAMKSPVVTVSPDDTLAEVSMLFHEKRISGAPVVDEDGRLVGIVSEGDLIEKSQELRVSVYYDVFGWVSPQTPVAEMARFTQGLCTVADTKVSEVMTRKVVTVGPEESLERAARLMATRNINRLPVVDGSELVGIVSRADLVWAMVHLCEVKPGILEE